VTKRDERVTGRETALADPAYSWSLSTGAAVSIRYPARLVVLILPLVLGPRLSQAQAPAGTDSLALARKWTTWLYANQLDSLVAAHPEQSRSPELKSQLAQNRDELRRRAGDEVKLIEERFVKRNGSTQYWRTAQFSNPDVGEPVMVRWAVNKNWQIIGLGVNPLSMAPPVDKP
jgi:hypothetical protein